MSLQVAGSRTLGVSGLQLKVGTPRSSTVAAAAMVGAASGYYLASLLGLQLRLLPATSSVFWPPNAVLTAVLLLTPHRWWPAVLCSALPVHLYLQLQTEWPLSFIVAIFLTNCLEAVLAAAGMHLLSDAPSRLDSLRRLAAFLAAAAIGAPVLSSFADAAAVTWLRGEPYWTVWSTRLLSNILAEVTVVPAILGGAAAFGLRRARPTLLRRVEALLLAAGVGVVGWLAASPSLAGVPALQVVSTQTPLTVQLPFLLWAAIRFGPAGAGLTLLTTSVLGAWALVHGTGPFASIAPASPLTAFRLSLIMLAVTLLVLSTLAEERRQTQQALGQRLRFEGLLSRLSAALFQLPGDRLPGMIDTWLGQIGDALGIEAMTLFLVSDDGGGLRPAHAWGAATRSPRLEPVARGHDQWARHSRRSASVLVVRAGDRQFVSEPCADGAADAIVGGAIPLVSEGGTLGVLAFGPMRDAPSSPDVAGELGLVAELLAAAFRRKRSEDALRESELTKSAILQSLTSGVAVVDRGGRLVQFNERWLQIRQLCRGLDVAAGGDLLASCGVAAADGEMAAAEIAVGIAEVLSGARPRFDIERRTECGKETRYWTLSAVKPHRLEDGAVLTWSDVTGLRRAEMEAQRSRQELAHVDRVTTVGELTASLAHQLNQPLAAIMTNAQAAQRLLDARGPDLIEVRAILADIVQDDRRASDVIKRLRDLLRKGECEMTRVNLTAAIRGVVELLASEAIMRNVVVSLRFEREPLYVLGDRVQLQQVILNLLHNAMDAVVEKPEGARFIAISCGASDGAVRFDVVDSGPGLPGGTEEQIFEPFHTTKAAGMGMGLSIVRSIVEAHSGAIRAANESGGGARFEVRLPAAD